MRDEKPQGIPRALLPIGPELEQPRLAVLPRALSDPFGLRLASLDANHSSLPEDRRRSGVRARRIGGAEKEGERTAAQSGPTESEPNSAHSSSLYRVAKLMKHEKFENTEQFEL
ncbi:Rho Gtpase-Activating Protein 11A [Manis pentadactyla]|nr:Rho Gtpase-Activating Protein 11A [Manis pentadactyla]